MDSKKKYTCDQINSYVEQVKSAKCIFVHGVDAFQRDKCFKQIINILNVSVNDGMNSFLFYGDDYARDDKISPIMESLNMMSFDLSEKIVSIKHFEQLNKGAMERIAKYTDDPAPYAKLILVSDKLDSRLTAVKTLTKNSLHMETTEMKYASHLLQWLNGYLRENQIRMDEATKNYFVNTVEPDAFTAYNEMKKLELYVGNTKTITTNDIKECTINSKTYTVFELTDAIGYKQKENALKIIENLVNNGESIIMVVSMLTNFFFTLWRLDALRRKNISASELMANHMNDINPYFREKYIKFLKAHDRASIENALKQLYICDSRAKLSMAEDMVLGVSVILMTINDL